MKVRETNCRGANNFETRVVLFCFKTKPGVGWGGGGGGCVENIQCPNMV